MPGRWIAHYSQRAIDYSRLLARDRTVPALGESRAVNRAAMQGWLIDPVWVYLELMWLPYVVLVALSRQHWQIILALAVSAYPLRPTNLGDCKSLQFLII
jgi:hypothetical protein